MNTETWKVHQFPCVSRFQAHVPSSAVSFTIESILINQATYTSNYAFVLITNKWIHTHYMAFGLQVIHSLERPSLCLVYQWLYPSRESFFVASFLRVWNPLIIDIKKYNHGSVFRQYPNLKKSGWFFLKVVSCEEFSDRIFLRGFSERIFPGEYSKRNFPEGISKAEILSRNHQRGISDWKSRAATAFRSQKTY